MLPTCIFINLIIKVLWTIVQEYLIFKKCIWQFCFMNSFLYFLAVWQSAIPRNLKSYTTESDVIRCIMLCLNRIQWSISHITVDNLYHVVSYMYRTALFGKLLLICEMCLCVLCWLFLLASDLLHLFCDEIAWKCAIRLARVSSFFIGLDEFTRQLHY